MAKKDTSDTATLSAVPPDSKMDAVRVKALDLAIQQIQKDFGEGAIMKMGDSHRVDIDVIPTGNLLIDRALGVGGFPRGRIIEIYGPESSGKTTLTLTAVAQAQRRGGLAAFIDVEHALDPEYSKKLGVNMNDLLVSQPSSGEEALQIVEQLVRSNAVDVIVLDSVAALVTKHELEGDIGDATVGAQARLMSQALRKLTSFISKARTCVIFTNQIREKIGVMFGSPEPTPGGRALKFYASVRIDIRRIGQIKSSDGTVTGNVYAPGGGDPQFVFCTFVSSDGNPDPAAVLLTYSCSVAQRCKGGTCAVSDWSFYSSVTLPGSFFRPR